MRKYIIAALVLAAAATACNVTDLNPNSKYDTSYGFKDSKNAELYLNSFYPMIYHFGQFGKNALGGNNSSMSDGLTDILKYGAIVAGSGDCNMIMTIDGQQSVTNNYFDSWTTCYGWVRRINEFLSGLDSYRSNFTEDEYRRYRGEAMFFRAYSWFLIMRCHASVKDDLGAVLYTDIDDMGPDTKNHARSTVSETWDQVYSDISYAVENLPEPAAATGRLNRYAALALEARSMLYAGRYSQAKEAAKAIMDSGLYGFIDDYAAIFKDLSNTEVIWGYGFISGSLTHTFDKSYSQPGDICKSGSYGSGLAGPTQEFVDSYDNADGTAFDISDTDRRFITNENASGRDPRLAASVLWNGALWKGRALECYEGRIDQKYMPYGQVNSPGNTVTGYYMRKLLDEDNDDYVINGSYQPWIEFRYAEMVLIYAECCAMESDYTTAWRTVSSLRQARFGREDVYTAPINSRTTALDVILKERSIELCFEGHRFWDLRRTGRAQETLDGKKYSGVLWQKGDDGSFTPSSVSCDMGARRYPSRFDSFPIPQTEISNNTLAKQNADW